VTNITALKPRLIRSLLTLCVAIPALAGEFCTAQTKLPSDRGLFVEALPDPCRLSNPPPECKEDKGKSPNQDQGQGIRTTPMPYIAPHNTVVPGTTQSQ
jgi:hypothetical protein